MTVKPLQAGIVLCALSTGVQAGNQDFDATLACYTQAQQPGIAVRLEQGNKLIYSKAAGLADIKRKLPLNTEQVFQIGSITKQFTAAAILQLADRKKLSIQDPLGKYIPSLSPDYAKTLVGEYQSAGQPRLHVTYEDGVLYGQKGNSEKRKLIARANNAFSLECTQNYYQLSVTEGKTSLTPIGLYRGKGKPLFKL
ncbi:hypothetical protein C3B51_04205 [Pseudoalteromonas rubra]|uniref:Beta-lactamase-related domain-containing protein n=1 Tax=Pseudoalteromonas rubra TaxID=43658 RepID=A0A4Q7EL15_9GAMM|nr:serine hydrolase domain-containing protein [Pseudoalteromonas rubra]RZM84319.1 hypothetical protein C3B51_04205 [Pseudoalteromonas rubra]